jgi:hypothetical protein
MTFEPEIFIYVTPEQSAEIQLLLQYTWGGDTFIRPEHTDKPILCLHPIHKVFTYIEEGAKVSFFEEYEQFNKPLEYDYKTILNQIVLLSI